MNSFDVFAATSLAAAQRGKLLSDMAAAHLHLVGVLDAPLVDALTALRDRRFLEIVHQLDDVEEWARFAEHEMVRNEGRESRWTGDALKQLAPRLCEWAANPAADPAVTHARLACEQLRIDPDWLQKAQGKQLALDAFRAALWRLWDGGR